MHIAHETAGAARTRSSLRPLRFGGGANLQTSDALRRENAESYSAVIARRLPSTRSGTTGRPSIPERSCLSSMLWNTGSPAFAGDDGGAVWNV